MRDLQQTLQGWKSCLELEGVIHNNALTWQQRREGLEVASVASSWEGWPLVWDQAMVPEGGRHLLLRLHQQQSKHQLL